MVRRSQTYRITHIGGWQIDLYLSTPLLEELENDGSSQQQEARLYICRHFREACEDQILEFNLRYVTWSEITIEPLAPVVAATRLPPSLLVPDLAKG